MGLEKITPVVLRGELGPEKETLIAEYKANKKRMEELLENIHELEGRLGIDDKNRDKFNQAA